jgi:hypothetical protein
VSSKKLLCSSLAILSFAVAAPSSFAQAPQKDVPYRGQPVRSRLSDASVERKIEALLKQMTLEEKVGQLVQYSVGTPTGPGTGRTGYPEMIASGEVGALFNLENVQQVNLFQHAA